MSTHEDELFVFADEDATPENTGDAVIEVQPTHNQAPTFHLPATSDKWKVLIADDEEEVHTVTRFALMDYTYKGKKLQFLNAYTGKEAVNILRENPDIALILLDVVMEHHHAGLETVQTIRNDIQNHFVRIILRTGQPGQAPEDEVIVKYDINDYKNKSLLVILWN